MQDRTNTAHTSLQGLVKKAQRVEGLLVSQPLRDAQRSTAQRQLALYSQRCRLPGGPGQAHLHRRTPRKNLRSSLKRCNVWCKENRPHRLNALFDRLNAKLRGYYNYFGIHGNFAGLQQFFSHAMRFLWRALNQRSQRKSYNWAGFRELLQHFGVVRPRIVGRPRARMASSVAAAAAEARISEEPDAVIPHAGICAGAVG